MLLGLVGLGGCPAKPDGDSTETTTTDDTGTTVIDDTATTARDQDGDGQDEGVDCDDLDPTVYLGAPELCDGQDNDCDRLVDEDLTVSIWYPDADADGYGTEAGAVEECAAPEGYSSMPGDCDDTDPAFRPDAAEDDCTDPNDYNCDGSVGYVDADGDGWVACLDCDDAEPAVNPVAAELCNERDDDCDGEVDTDAVDQGSWYTDADGDGWGDDDSVVTSCTDLPDRVGQGGDCDDTDPAFNPGVPETDCTDPNDYNCDGSVGYVDADGDGFPACDAAECDDADASANGAASEVCDGADNDCDGLYDEGDAADAPSWYPDRDGDGYGDDALSLTSCTAPRGYVAFAGDCDDGDSSVNPGAAEDCARAVDVNCDGSVAYADADADGYAACTECDDSDALTNPAGVEVCNGRDDDCDGDIDSTAADRPTWYYDGDGDGYGDSTVTVVDCTAPAGFVAAGGDCRDTDAAYFPGADEADCRSTADYNCDGSTGSTDADGDGWAACEECDDSDPEINPAADEQCDGVDEDCDGRVDNDAVDARAWYTDADGDGFGDSTLYSYACESSPGTTPLGGDCDDTDAAYNPGALEADCTDPNDYNCDGSVAYEDRDGDGFAACDAAECDDTRASVYLGAEEYCNGIDDNCNGVVDGDLAVDRSTWYADADGDGWGDASRALAACTAPAGYAERSGDCDDRNARYYPGAPESCTDPNDYSCDGSTGYADADSDGVAACEDCDDADSDVYPGAPEYCNGVDDNCNGTVDGTAALDRATWYADSDVDGYGAAGVTSLACSRPSGYVDNDGDCDDGDGTVYPGAVETCDGEDEDCDGVGDESDAVDRVSSWRDGDGDGYGASGVSTLGCTVPSGYVGNDDDCDDGTAAVSPAAVEACNGADDDCDGAADESGATGEGTWYADRDGDGYGDASAATAACSAPPGTVADDDDCDDASTAVYPGAPETCGDGIDEDCDGTDLRCDWTGTYAADEADLAAAGAAGAGLGSALTAGDADGDGLGDLFAGAPGGDGLVVGWVGGPGTLDAGTAPVHLLGDGGEFGAALALVGDLAADGGSDLAVAAPGTGTTLSEAGRVWLFLGDLSAASGVADADAWVDGEQAGDRVGSALAALPDLDGDGSDELLIGSADWADGSGDRPGGVVLHRGGDVSGAVALRGDADAAWWGEADGDRLGASVAAADLDGDGSVEVYLGAPGFDAGAGRVYRVEPSMGDWIGLGAGEAWADGDAAGDAFGAVVAVVGDLDSDGYLDLAVGGSGAGAGAGAAWVYTGAGSATLGRTPADAAFRFDGDAAGDGAGTSVAGAGDVDGDGFADLLLAAPGVDDGASASVGGAALWYGPTAGAYAWADAGAWFHGPAAGDALGAVAGPGDTDGDGYADFALGAPGSDAGGADAGAVWLFFGLPL